MNNGKIIWWIILIAMAVIVIWQFYWKDEEKKCCTFSGLGYGEADGVTSLTYCKRDGKYYVSGTGGFTGTIPEKEISEQEFNENWENNRCIK